MISSDAKKSPSIIPMLIVVILLVLGAAYMVAYREGREGQKLPVAEFLATSTPAYINQ